MTDFAQYTFSPALDTDIEEYWHKQKKLHWTPEELNLAGDRNDWDKLKDNEKEFLEGILAFFAQADGLVNENLIDNFQKELGENKFIGKDIKKAYTAQAYMETIHSETYSNLIDVFIRDLHKKHKIFNAIKYYPCIGKIADWMMKYMDDTLPILERVVAFACIEGVLFQGAFCGIYWFKRKGILNGLCESNEMIARDETLHTDLGILVYHKLTKVYKCKERLSERRIYEIFESIIKLVENFVKDILHVELIGLSSGDMIKYVKCCANKLLEKLEYKPLFKVKNPFDWMAIISLNGKTNFFEKNSTEYSKFDKAFSFSLGAEI